MQVPLPIEMQKKNQTELIGHFLSAKDQVHMQNLLAELLTPVELIELSKRHQIIKMLKQGIPQRNIAQQLGVGIATVTRGSRTLKNKPG